MPERGPLAAARRGAALLVALLFLLPLLWTVSLSLRPQGLPLPTRLELVPPEPTLANYPALFELLPLGRYALNSAIVAVVAVALTLLTTSWAGFALAQLPGPWRRVLVGVLLAVLLVPVMALWVPRFMVYRWLGVLDTLWALILPALFGSSPLYTLILFWAFRRIPPDTIEAARLDGCGAFQLWWRVGLPMVRPSLAAVACLGFVYYWSSFTEPMLYLTSDANATLPLALRALRQMHPSRWPLLMAGATLVTLPVLLVFLLGQRFFIQRWFGAEGRPDSD